ncbi:MAG TPA: serine hydrolase domain-containing protein, partial [Glaciihabitans sp.]|nr:serine hydrolase domain-containing protein [Glaciihabitans sp.]
MTQRRARMLIPLLAVMAGLTAATPPPEPPPHINIQNLDHDVVLETVTRITDELLVPGAVVYLSSPQGVIEVAHGVTEYNGSVPVEMDQHVRIGSVTKTWTGTAVLQLVDEGIVGLDEPISQYLEGVPNGENITIRQMLSMRSGLANYTTDVALNAAMDEDPSRAWSQQELLDIAFAKPPSFPPGTAFEYSNTNTVLLGLLVEKIDGAPLGDVFENRFFTPLEMENSSFPDVTDVGITDPHPNGYMFGTNSSTITTAELPPDELAAALDGTLLPNDYPYLNPSWAWSAGAGISTVSDLARWSEAIVTDELLCDDVQQERID